MPVIFRWRNYRFFFFSNEGSEPPHVHVSKGECEAKFWLHDCTLAYNVGFKHNETKTIQGIITQNQALFVEKWYEYEKRKY